MTTNQLRALFDAHYPLPHGVKWDGDHFEADRTVVGSFTNATTWAHLWRGFLTCAREFGHVD